MQEGDLKLVSARTRCGWVRFMEFGESLYGKRLPLKLKGIVYKNYERPASFTLYSLLNIESIKLFKVVKIC